MDNFSFIAGGVSVITGVLIGNAIQQRRINKMEKELEKSHADLFKTIDNAIQYVEETSKTIEETTKNIEEARKSQSNIEELLKQLV